MGLKCLVFLIGMWFGECVFLLIYYNNLLNLIILVQYDNYYRNGIKYSK